MIDTEALREGWMSALNESRHPREVREVKRAFRARQRAADRAPLSDKVVYPRRLVDVAPVAKKGRSK